MQPESTILQLFLQSSKAKLKETFEDGKTVTATLD
jgi:hypothetical protein